MIFNRHSLIIGLIGFIILLFGISVVSLQPTNAGGGGAFVKLDDVTGKFKVPKKKYKMGDTVKGELILTNSGTPGPIELVYQICFDAACKRKLPFSMNLKSGKTSIPIAFLIDKKFKTIHINVLVVTNDISFGGYRTKTFTHTIGKKRRAQPVFSPTDLSVPFSLEKPGFIKGFCPLKAEAVKTACKIPDSLEVFKTDSADCLFGVRHTDNRIDSLVDFYLGDTHFLFTGKYIPYSNDELREAKLASPSNKNGTLEDIPSLGDTSFMIKRPVNEDDERSGSKNFQFGLYTKYKKLAPIIMSGGPNLEKQTSELMDNLTLHTEFTPRGYGCDADEVKDLMKNTVFPEINKL